MEIECTQVNKSLSSSTYRFEVRLLQVDVIQFLVCLKTVHLCAAETHFDGYERVVFWDFLDSFNCCDPLHYSLAEETDGVVNDQDGVTIFLWVQPGLLLAIVYSICQRRGYPTGVHFGLFVRRSFV